MKSPSPQNTWVAADQRVRLGGVSSSASEAAEGFRVLEDSRWLNAAAIGS